MYDSSLIYDINKTVMRKKDLIYLMFIMLFAVLISCKDDSVTNSNTPSVTIDSLLFSYDSIYSGPLGHNNIEADYYINNEAVKKIKGTFDLNTNDVSDSICLATFSVIGDSTFGKHIYGKNAHGPFSEIFPVYFTNPDSALVRFTVSSPIPGNLSMTMKNIKLYKTN